MHIYTCIKLCECIHTGFICLFINITDRSEYHIAVQSVKSIPDDVLHEFLHCMSEH